MSNVLIAQDFLALNEDEALAALDSDTIFVSDPGQFAYLVTPEMRRRWVAAAERFAVNLRRADHIGVSAHLIATCDEYGVTVTTGIL